MVKRKRKTLLIILMISLASVVGLVLANYDSIRGQRARAFTSAAEEGNVRLMKVLCLCGADPRAEAPGRGAAIFGAGWTGQTDSIRYLLDKGVDINQKDKYGWTALMAATSQGHIETVKFLISKGANLNAMGEDGTALRIAVEENRAEIGALLKEQGAKDCYGYRPDDCR